MGMRVWTERPHDERRRESKCSALEVCVPLVLCVRMSSLAVAWRLLPVRLQAWKRVDERVARLPKDSKGVLPRAQPTARRKPDRREMHLSRV